MAADVSLSHHGLTLVMDGDLYRAPLDMKKVKRVLDIGTGTGNYASRLH